MKKIQYNTFIKCICKCDTYVNHIRFDIDEVFMCMIENDDTIRIHTYNGNYITAITIRTWRRVFQRSL